VETKQKSIQVEGKWESIQAEEKYKSILQFISVFRDDSANGMFHYKHQSIDQQSSLNSSDGKASTNCEMPSVERNRIPI
jgi:hypothetical protein